MTFVIGQKRRSQQYISNVVYVQVAVLIVGVNLRLSNNNDNDSTKSPKAQTDRPKIFPNNRHNFANVVGVVLLLLTKLCTVIPTMYSDEFSCCTDKATKIQTAL